MKATPAVQVARAPPSKSAKARAWFGGVTAIKLYIVVFALLLGVLTGLFLLVPILKDNCVIFTTRCDQIRYQRGPNGQLLVIDSRTGFTYWYDGVAFVFSYGDICRGHVQNSWPTELRVTRFRSTLPSQPESFVVATVQSI